MHKCEDGHNIPNGYYYIEEILQFGDFEVEEQSRITWYSKDKNELIDLCKANNWACAAAGNSDSWHTHFVKYRNIFGSIEN